jgi:hypothetical protein
MFGGVKRNNGRSGDEKKERERGSLKLNIRIKR